MNIAMLYINGPDEGLDRLTQVLGLTETSRWKAGDPIRAGKTHENSGIEFELADLATPRDLIYAVRNFLHGWLAKGISLYAFNLKGELSIGVAVGDSKQFTAHLNFSVDDALLLGTLGVELSITAYPTSDEANE